jgi:hypothetical protein
MSIKDDLVTLLSQITYTDALGNTKQVNVYKEEDVVAGKVRFKTPALVVRGVRNLTDPIDIGWNIYNELIEIDVSLYTKVRADDYAAAAVKEEITSQFIDLIKANKNGIGGYDYLKLTSITDRDHFEEVGILRRDFSLEMYKEG